MQDPSHYWGISYYPTPEAENISSVLPVTQDAKHCREISNSLTNEAKKLASILALTQNPNLRWEFIESNNCWTIFFLILSKHSRQIIKIFEGKYFRISIFISLVCEQIGNFSANFCKHIVNYQFYLGDNVFMCFTAACLHTFFLLAI